MRPNGLDRDMDALHVLPLSIIPLQSKALGKARLIKNAQLRGVVELFSDQATGSGQVEPDELAKVFDLSGDKRQDLEIIKSLSLLGSYDVYSLRRELRRLGIPVNQHRALKLSNDKTRELEVYMKMFTRPLVANVYGSEEARADSLAALLELFASPDFKQARENLKQICKRLEITLSDLPRFLEDYGDVYLSLAYYRYCLDEDLPKIRAFLETLPEIRASQQLKQDRALIQACSMIEQRLKRAVGQISSIIELFRLETEDMWCDLTHDGFQRASQLIHDYQTMIGGGICAIHVKMKHWSDSFPSQGAGGLNRRADFIMTHMRQGLERLDELDDGALRRTRESDSVFLID